METPSPIGPLAPPSASNGSAAAPASAAAQPPFFVLGWHSIDRAERAATDGELARAEEGFLIALHAFGHSRNSWLEGMAILALAAVYRLEGHPLPDWLAGRVGALPLKPDQVRHLLDFLLLTEVTPPDSPHLWGLLADLRSYRTGGRRTPLLPQPSEGLDFHSASGELCPTGRLTIGRRAAVAGDFDIAELAFRLAANEYRQTRQPVLEAFALVEMAAMYQLQNRSDRLPTLIRRVRCVRTRPALSPDQIAVVQLAIELVESSREDPIGLEIFRACWPSAEAHEAESDS